MMALASERAPSNSFCLEDVYDNEISPNGWFQSGQNVTYFSELPLFICILWEARYYLLELGQRAPGVCIIPRVCALCGYGWWTFFPVHLYRINYYVFEHKVPKYLPCFVLCVEHKNDICCVRRTLRRNNVCNVIKRNFVIGAGCECDLSFKSFNCYEALCNYTLKMFILWVVFIFIIVLIFQYFNNLVVIETF